MNLDDFESRISELTEWAQQTDCYDIALFRIWLIFEKYLIEKFIDYATGDFSPNCQVTNKIQFIDSNHLKYFLQGDRTYVEYLGKIEKLSKHIFNNNPFTIILEDAEKAKIYSDLKVIRNQIAHDSEESREKFFRDCLFSNSSLKELEVNGYLKRKTSRQNPKSNYTRLTQGIVDIVKFIDDPFF